MRVSPGRRGAGLPIRSQGQGGLARQRLMPSAGPGDGPATRAQRRGWRVNPIPVRSDLDGLVDQGGQQRCGRQDQRSPRVDTYNTIDSYSHISIEPCLVGLKPSPHGHGGDGLRRVAPGAARAVVDCPVFERRGPAPTRPGFSRPPRLPRQLPCLGRDPLRLGLQGKRMADGSDLGWWIVRDGRERQQIGLDWCCPA